MKSGKTWTAADLRDALRPRPGYTTLEPDFSGGEMVTHAQCAASVFRAERQCANFSKLYAPTKATP